MRAVEWCVSCIKQQVFKTTCRRSARVRNSHCEKAIPATFAKDSLPCIRAFALTALNHNVSVELFCFGFGVLYWSDMKTPAFPEAMGRVVFGRQVSRLPAASFKGSSWRVSLLQAVADHAHHVPGPRAHHRNTSRTWY